MVNRILYTLPQRMPSPAGGVTVTNRHVQHLLHLGYPVYLLPPNGVDLPLWLEQPAPVWQGPRHVIGVNDVVVFGEYSRKIYEYLSTNEQRAKSVYFCQNHFGLQAVRSPYGEDRLNPIISRKNTDCVMVVSHVSAVEVAHQVADVPIAVIPPEIADDQFRDQEKQKKIAYMPRKWPQVSEQILRRFRFRYPDHDDYEFIKIDGVSASRVASTLATAEIFLSLSRREGLGLPPLEAMASGCLVTGFDGEGGKDFATKDNGIWCPDGDVEACVEGLHQLCLSAKRRDRAYHHRRAAGFATAKRYGRHNFETKLTTFWQRFLTSHHL